MDKEQQKEFILNGNLWKVLFDLSWPAVIAMVLIGMNNMVDAIFIGRFVENAKAAVAGISLAYPLTMIALGLGSLIGVGAGSLLSIVLGAKDEETQKKLIGNVHYLTVVISIAVTVLGVLFTDKLLYIMGGRGDALIQGTAYLKTTFYGSFFWIYGLGANMIVRAEGKMKTAAVIMAIGLVVNAAAWELRGRQSAQTSVWRCTPLRALSILQAEKPRFTVKPFRLTATEKSSSRLFRWECRALL